MKETEIIKKCGIKGGEVRMISETRGIIWRENGEGDYELHSASLRQTVSFLDSRPGHC